MDEEAKRKLAAKRFNEHIKLLTTTLNAIALIILAGAALQPILDSAAERAVNWPWVIVGSALHMLARGLIRLIRPE